MAGLRVGDGFGSTAVGLIEQALYFALGFCVAGLIALSLAPAVWARALRLTRRRIELLTPMDAREAAADRDHVRAEAALAIRRAEQALEAERARRAEQLAQNGRAAAAIAALEDRHVELTRTLAERDAALARAEAEAREATGTQGAYAQMTFAAEGLRDRKEAERAVTAQALDAMAALAESRRIAVAALETRNLSDRVALDAVNDAAQRLRESLAERSREAAALADERAFLKEELARAEASRQQLVARHAAQTERLTQTEADLAAARDATRRAETVALRGKEASEAAQARAEAIQATLDAATARVAENMALAQDRERLLSDRLERARAEVAALRGALEEARRARALARAEAAPAPPGDAQLRALIAEIGRAMLGEPAPQTPASQSTDAQSPAARSPDAQSNATQSPASQAAHAPQAAHASQAAPRPDEIGGARARAARQPRAEARPASRASAWTEGDGRAAGQPHPGELG